MANRILGNYCRTFRIETLGKTLKEVEQDDYIKTLSAFEHGRSNNYEHVFKYINACDTEEQVQLFMKMITHIANIFYKG